jgi:chromosome partitioning protein
MGNVERMGIVALVNHKGGVGKSTTAVNLAAALSKRGRRVLVIDADSQHNATSWIGADAPPDLAFADVLRRPSDAANAIGPSTVGGVDLLYGSRETAVAERELQAGPSPTTALRRALRTVTRYDDILIDSPPGLGCASLNAIVAADELLVPAEPHGLSLAGLGQLRETITDLVALEVIATEPPMRVVLCRYDGRLALAKEVAAHLRDAADVAVFKTEIRVNTKLTECVGARQSIFDYEPAAIGAADYAALSMEFKP